MLDALAWLEWRRARLPLLLGSLAGFGIPFLLVIAAAAIHGPGPGAARVSTGGIVRIVLPPFFVLFYWPLWAVALPIHQLDADRRDGTRRFLLDRPVSRRRTWIVRNAAALAATAAVIVASVAGWLLAVRAAGGEPPAGTILRHTPPPSMLFLAVAVPFLAFAAGAAIGSLGGRSLPAVFLGGVLVAGGVTAAMIGIDFAAGRRLWIIDGYLVLLALLLLATSYVAEATGEPAGRYRYRRASVVLLGIPLLCGLAWSGAAYREHRSNLRKCFVPTFPRETVTRGNLALLRTAEDLSSRWVVDPDTGRRLRLLRGVLEAAWSPEGRSLALLLRGGHAAPARLVILDGETLAPVREIPLGKKTTDSSTLLWTDAGIFFTAGRAGGSCRLYQVDAETGGARTIPFRGGFAFPRSLPAPDRLRVVVPGLRREGETTTFDWNRVEVIDLDPRSGRILQEESLRLEPFPAEFPRYQADTLSPTGTWVARGAAGGSDDAPRLEFVLEQVGTARRFRLPAGRKPRSLVFLPDDGVAWVDSADSGKGRLVTWRPGWAAPRAVPLPPGMPGRRVDLRPDGRGERLLVESARRAETGAWQVHHAWLWTPGTETFEELRLPGNRPTGLALLNWATPTHLAGTMADGSIAFLDVERWERRPVPLEP